MRKMLAGLSLLSVLGCGSSSPSFVGIWTISTGNETTECPSTANATLTGTLTIIQGNSSGTIEVANSALNGCTETYTVNGNVASTTSSQNCPIQLNGNAATLTFTSDRLTISSGTLSEVGAGTITAGSSSSGNATSCNFTTIYSAALTSS